MILTSPESYIDLNIPSIFVVGGITNCPNWQSYVCSEINREFPDELFIYNPRQSNYTEGASYAKFQIQWEFERLRYANFLFFWFSQGSLNPITLLEYGKYVLARNTFDGVYVGCHPNYERKFDVQIQTELQFGSDIKIFNDLQLLTSHAITDLYSKL